MAHAFLHIPARFGWANTSYVTFEDGDFRGMAKAIGADYIERVRVGPEESLAVDEEGLYTDKQVNEVASNLYGTYLHGHPIIGDVLFGIEAMTIEGMDWTGASEAEVRMHFARLAKAASESG